MDSNIFFCLAIQEKSGETQSSVEQTSREEKCHTICFKSGTIPILDQKSIPKMRVCGNVGTINTFINTHLPITQNGNVTDPKQSHTCPFATLTDEGFVALRSMETPYFERNL